jgi:hypothetical protein
MTSTERRTRAAAEPGRPAAPAEDAPLVSEPMPADYVAAVAQEYGQYRAKYLLNVYGAPAFAPGAPVPASHPMVEGWLADGSIERVEQA